MSYTTDQARWRALTIRDARANGCFVYAVKSTGIFCRPTCSGRLARRANVGFYKTPAEAAAAGFRGCKRCKPESVAVEDPQERAVNKACSLIESALKEPEAKAIKLATLANSVGLTPRYFHKIFKDKTGMTPKEYASLEKWRQQQETATSTSEGEQMDRAAFDVHATDFSEFFDFNIDLELPLPLEGAREMPTLENLNVEGNGGTFDASTQLLLQSGDPIGWDHWATIPSILTTAPLNSLDATAPGSSAEFGQSAQHLLDSQSV